MEKIGIALSVGLIMFIVICVILGGVSLVGIGIPNSGQHTGVITSVEQEGLFWKTWKIYVKTNTQSSQEDTYCITNSNVVEKAQQVSKDAQEITVKYSRGFIVWPWQCNGESSIVTEIK